jgi:hypothetical protein
MSVIEVPEVGTVHGGARKDAGRNGREHAAGVGERLGIGTVQRGDLIAAGGVGHDTERAADLVGQLGNSIEFCVALDLNADENKIPNNKTRPGAASVDAVPMGLAAILDDESDYLAGKVDMFRSLLDVVED